MAVTYGFYNSFNGDRRYDALQMSSIFDGIIRDGVFMYVTDRLLVSADGASMFVRVAPGRAWFNHTWTLNDAILPVAIPQSEVVLSRIDAVVIDVNQDTRTNDILVVSGTPSSNPLKPTLAKGPSHWQYPLAYVRVNAQTTTIRQADITNAVGTSECPWVTGPLETVSIDSLFNSWRDEYNRFYTEETSKWRLFYDEETARMLATAASWRKLWQEWYDEYTSRGSDSFEEFLTSSREEFMTWFQTIRDILDGDTAGNIADILQDHERRITILERFKHDVEVDNIIRSPLQVLDSIYDAILDENGETITDENDDVISAESIYFLADLENEDNELIEVVQPICFC